MPNNKINFDHDKLIELNRAIELRDWAAVDRLTGMSPEEAERILREEPMIDGADFNRMLEELDRQEDAANAAQGIDVANPCGSSLGATSPRP